MVKPKILVLSGYGLNCEEETKYAFELAGGEVKIVHINDLISNIKQLERYQILAFPGGFSYGDDTGSGNAFANRIKNHIWQQVKQFVEQDNLVIGICNGFQILVNLGLLPALNDEYGERQVALLHNDNARYTVRWVDLKVQNNSPWLTSIDEISLPIAHGEGKFYADVDTLRLLNQDGLVALRYIEGEICQTQNLSANPNGALEDIAAITDGSKKVLGMMPHPERNMFFEQLPNWTNLKLRLESEGKKVPNYSNGLKIFKNAVEYFK